MGDKELLQLAAKAAGFSLLFEYSDGEFDAKKHGVWVNEDVGTPWNALTDIYDALRLAKALGLRPMLGAVEHPDGSMTVENDVSDRDLSTCRAIVRAAAEIGKQL